MRVILFLSESRGVNHVVQSGALGLCRGSGESGRFEGVYASVLRGFQVLLGHRQVLLAACLNLRLILNSYLYC